MRLAMTITVLYSCAGCRLRNATVVVPARESTEDVAVWMNDTVRRVSADHRRRSPFCRARAMQEVKIPMTGAERIGGPSIQ